MTLLATMLWPLVAASALLGCAIGGATGLPRTPGARWAALALVVSAALAGALAGSGLVPGRIGFWLECGALDLTGYLIGATLIAALTDRAAPRP